MDFWNRNKENLLFFGLLFVFLGYSIWLIYRTSFHLYGQKYYCLFDDAMISMTYAKRVVDGFGLNWAMRGKPVEGYTNPLWTFIMIPINLLPIEDSQKSLPVQLISALFLVLNLVFVKKILDNFLSEENKKWLWVLPVVLTATYYPLTHWAIVGMESGLQAFFLTLSIWLTFRLESDPKKLAHWISLGTVMGLALLLRMDMILMLGAIGIYLLPTLLAHWKKLPYLALLAVGPFLAYLIFRKMYFGEWLPNTYFLKLVGIPAEIRIGKGLWVFLDFFLPILIPVTALIIGTFAFLKNRRFYLILSIVLLTFAYSIYVGGDAWEWSTVGANRFICFSFPLLFLIVGGLWGKLSNFLGTRFKEQGLRIACGGLLLVLLLGWFNGLIFHKDQKDKWLQSAGITPPLHSYDNIMALKRCIFANQHVTPDARVATVWAGIPAYFGNWYPLDLLGYNDHKIAHGNPAFVIKPEKYIDYYPGHVKWNYEYSIDSLKPDMVLNFWARDRDREGNYVRQLEENGIYYFQDLAWIRSDSRKVHFD